MLYSQMSAEQRQRIFEDPQNYPLRVSFLGKAGILTLEEIAFLQSHGVDFDVDDKQLAAIMAVQQAT